MERGRDRLRNKAQSPFLNLARVGYLKSFYFANYFYKEKPLGV
jgi:hypothetical protein